MSARTLVDILRARAEATPNGVAFSFLSSERVAETEVTYAEIDTRARAIAVSLATAAAPGARVLLLYPPGVDYVAAFFGCLYAGLIAVPAYPTETWRARTMEPRLNGIIESARASVVLGPPSAVDAAPSLSTVARSARWIVSDATPKQRAAEWRRPDVTADSVAFLQFTSGSTSTPRGVVLTHAQLLANIADIGRSFGASRASRGVIWLPPFHDMGLIGGILLPIVAGFPVTLMAPLTFLQRPLRWLRAISRHRATISGGPNFAYELCVRKATPADVAELDLSSWEVAFTGAEPVRAETLSRFAEMFAPAGFRPSAFQPCYGLAEATLMVTSTKQGGGAVVRRFDAPSLEGGIVAAPAGSRTRTLVGVGAPPEGTRIHIVDPKTGAPAPPGRIGEICVTGPGIAAGYFERPEDSAAVFREWVREIDGRVLRTGDLGFVEQGELFITGRRKDLIIIRGRNIHPADVEMTVGGVDAAFRPEGGAAFSVDVDGEERLVVVHEVRGGEPEALARRAAEAVLVEHEIEAHAVVLVRPGVVPRTSSGKVQRSACKASYLRGEIAQLNAAVLRGTASEPAVAREHHGASDPNDVCDWLRAEVARLARVEPHRVADDVAPVAHGLDSLGVMELAASIEDRFGVALGVAALFEVKTLWDLTERVIAGRATGARSTAPIDGGSAALLRALSDGERALWFLHGLAPERTAYTIARAVHLPGADVDAVARALDLLFDRHPALRATFPLLDGEPARSVASSAAPGAIEVDREAGADGGRWRERIDAMIARPFDLERGPLFRVLVLTDGQGDVALAFAAHHIVADLSSLLALADDLGAILAHFDAGRALPLAPSIGAWIGCVAAERAAGGGAAMEAAAEYFSAQLAGAEFPIDLPADRARPAVASFRGRRASFGFDSAVLDGARSLARCSATTLHGVLLASLCALIYRYTGRRDVVVGVPCSVRSDRRAPSEGYAVNVLPVRVDVDGDESFGALVTRVRSALAGAIEHRSVPFARLVERLRPTRDASHSPLFQVMLQTLPSSPSTTDTLRAIALGVDGPAGALGGLTITPLTIAHAAAPVDLAFTLAETSHGLTGAVEYASDLFDPTTVERMVEHLGRLLADGVAAPDRAVGALSFLGADERRQVIEEWNAAPAPVLSHPTVHTYVRAQAARTPDALAVVFRGHTLTYAELVAQATRMARRLRAVGVGPETLVAVAMDRSHHLVVALLAIFEAGGAYLPLDVKYPQPRVTAILEEAHADLLLTQRRHARDFANSGLRVLLVDEEARPEPDGGEVAASDADPSDADPSDASLAYVISTSGSTGRPKGVAITHRSAAMLLEWARARFAASELARVLASTSICFDLSVFELFAPLAWGGTVVVVEDALELARMGDAGITMVNSVPSAMAELVATGAVPRTVRTVNLAGEALGGALVRAIYALDHVERVYNLYGPSEDTTYSTEALVPRDVAGAASIGRALPGKRAYVLDARGEPVPVGVTGELHLGGVGLARCYLRRPALTGEMFIPDAVSGASGARLYRTGDRARWRSDGTLDFLGRWDEQVKVRGHRIELGDVEAALSEVTADAVVTSDRDARGASRIVGYWVARAGGAATTGQVRALLEARLPTYLVPAVLIELPRLPRTLNGKVDRRALPPAGHAAVTRAYVAPRTEREVAVAQAFEEGLGVARVGAADDFFELGGHSLLALRIGSRLRERLGVELPLRALFEGRTVERIAARLGDETSRRPAPLEPLDRGGPLPTSFAQERLWFLSRWDPASTAYHMLAAVRLRGSLDADALACALEDVVARHEVLRVRFVERDGAPLVVAAEDEAPSPLARASIADTPPAERGAAIDAIVRHLGEAPFRLDRDPLLRAVMIEQGPDDHVLGVAMHHIVSDGWSLRVLVRELASAYEARRAGRPPTWAPLPIQYVDFAAWQRAHLASGILEGLLAHWRTALSGAPPAIELPTDRPRPPVQSTRVARHELRLGAGMRRAVEELCRSRGVTAFMALLAAFAAVLARHAGQEDLTIGTPIANRPRPETEPLIGFFVNMLPLRIDVAGSPSFDALLDRVRDAALAAYAHQGAPFEKIVEAMDGARDPSRTPLFNVVFALENEPPAPALSGLRVELLPAPPLAAKFDLSFTVVLEGDGLTATFDYAADLFDASTVARLADHFSRFVESATARPEQQVDTIELLSADERRLVVETWNATSMPVPAGVSVLDRFEEHARSRPIALAVDDARERLTYGALDARATSMAARLASRGIGHGDLVAVLLDASAGLAVAALAAWKRGAAYLPLDPAHPRERNAQILRDARAAVLVTRRDLEPALPESAAAVVLVDQDEGLVPIPPATSAHRPAGDDLAYVIATSGSTGRPNLVAITHGGLSNLAFARLREAPPAPDDRSALVASPAFDASVWVLWRALAAGASVRVPSEATRESPEKLLAWIAGERITTIFLPTPLAEELLALPLADGLALRTLHTGGDRLHPVSRTELPFTLINNYGPTEVTVIATAGAVACGAARGAPSIGRPLDNVRVYVVDARGAPVPVGVPGELLVGGAGLARGYLGDPALTASRFVPDAVSRTAGGRLYRTGDRARWRSDGSLEFLGRLDQQVKVRGYRIELGEVESALAEVAAEGVVVADRDARGGARLVGYWVRRVGGPATADEIRTSLARRLPSLMIPTALVELPRLPRTPNGKVDRKALPRVSHADVARAHVAPRTEHEIAVAAAFEAILGVERVGATDDFFELGGHSLLATRVASRLRDRLGADVPLQALFEARTVENIAALVDRYVCAPRAAILPAAAREETVLANLDQLSEGELDDILKELAGEGT